MPKKNSPIWHPFTQHALESHPINILRSEGTYLYTKDGCKIIDAISSWWVTTHGHSHPDLVSAIQKCASQLDQVIFSGFTHDPAEHLAKRLLQRLPDHLTRIFFSDSGSTAVEVALKMVLGYWHQREQPRRFIVALEHAYHGDTFGSMAIGARCIFNAAYEPMLFEVLRLPFPEIGSEQDTLNALDTLIQQYPDAIAGMIVEPLVLGAGGMKMYTPETLRALHKRCQKADIFFIADEVMTGFGRTGTFMACEQADVVPDVLCLSKGITGGVLPLGATLACERIYEAFYQPDRSKMFFHSSSYTGNPLACAVACANLDIWDVEPVLDRIRYISSWHAERLPLLAKHPSVRHVRHCGSIAAIELTDSVDGYLSSLRDIIYAFALEQNVLLRPLGNVVYILPPYCITKSDIDYVYHVITKLCDMLQSRLG